MPAISPVNAAFVAKLRSDRFGQGQSGSQRAGARGRDLNQLL